MFPDPVLGEPQTVHVFALSRISAKAWTVCGSPRTRLGSALEAVDWLRSESRRRPSDGPLRVPNEISLNITPHTELYKGLSDKMAMCYCITLFKAKEPK